MRDRSFIRSCLVFALVFASSLAQAQVELHGDGSAVGIVQGDGNVSITVRRGASLDWLQREIQRLHVAVDAETDAHVAAEAQRDLDRLLQLAMLIDARNNELAATLHDVTHRATREALAEALERPVQGTNVEELMNALDVRTRRILREAQSTRRQERTSRYGVFAGIAGLGAFGGAVFYHVRLRQSDQRLRMLDETSPGYLTTFRGAQQHYLRSLGLSSLALGANVVAATGALHPRSTLLPRWLTWATVGLGGVLAGVATGLHFYDAYSRGIPSHTFGMLLWSIAVPLLAAALFQFVARRRARARDLLIDGDGDVAVVPDDASGVMVAPGLDGGR